MTTKGFAYCDGVGVKQIISWLRGNVADSNWEVFPILGCVLEFGKTFQFCLWSSILRAANEAADFVNSYYGLKMSNSVWVD